MLKSCTWPPAYTPPHVQFVRSTVVNSSEAGLSVQFKLKEMHATFLDGSWPTIIARKHSDKHVSSVECRGPATRKASSAIPGSWSIVPVVDQRFLDLRPGGEQKPAVPTCPDSQRSDLEAFLHGQVHHRTSWKEYCWSLKLSHFMQAGITDCALAIATAVSAKVTTMDFKPPSQMHIRSSGGFV